MGSKRLKLQPFCEECGSWRNLQIHHAWHGTANRKLAEKDGLIVVLCEKCHRRLHDWDTTMDIKYQIQAEKKWLDQDHTRTIEDFIGRYGKNLL